MKIVLFLLQFQKRKGFTLLEVMVALAIIGVSIGIFFSMVGNSSKIRSKIDEHADSLLLARTKTEESFLRILDDIYTKQNEKKLYEGITANGVKWKVWEIDKYKEAAMELLNMGQSGEEEMMELPPKGFVVLNTHVEGIKIDTVSFIEQKENDETDDLEPE